ncbi:MULTISPECIES: PstA family ABC transporter permease [Caldilinea]|jgi:phosphate transport system permease protein|uniref:Phosphate ABC transporter permease protein n=1 Tax=Caldilinea aerophila (strain DSM 14535 / JCM 11387 / NBRC 104270 / STL-6-O1) TaxID=926550 RepID=I0I711_CALAS|nr:MULTISPECIES: ABC transporter permease subunit [Caldilinea]MBO9393999.1 ABC transporter permease subunit [Caldilinea sp.]BAM01049.1 phosphate ABC transporter permease protein [Caldilinea aerophila DSM 14535 = NBRC 104270]GIV72386.1 MAG: phosphate transport system permease protein PstA [Caldilinea sp.]
MSERIAAPIPQASIQPKSLHLKRRHLEEAVFVALMRLCMLSAAAALSMILAVILWRGIGALNIEMLLQPPRGSFYLGGGGGIANAITGSVLLASGATVASFCLATPLALYLHVYARRSRTAIWVRLTLDVLWGIPSIVYGAFGFTAMVFLGLRASLLAGIITLTLVVLPILGRTLDEVLSMAPRQLLETGFALGAMRLEIARLLLRQTLPGLFTALLLAFGRGIGDAASVLFTAGYTDNMPGGLLSPVASLPLAVFFQLSAPFPAVQERAYASALVLTIIILVISLAAHLSMHRLGRYVVR